MKNNFQIIPSEQTPKLALLFNAESWGQENSQLINELTDYAKTFGSACGLASNQVSNNGERILDRFFLEKDLRRGTWTAIINPIIINGIGMTDKSIEGCLTWQGEDIVADRYRRVAVAYYTMSGERKMEIITGFRSHIWQHEINHLDGVVETKYDKNDPNREPLPRITISNNDPCPCGSELKYKKCCKPFEL